MPSELSSRIAVAENAGRQLLRGWHARDSSGSLWSKGEAWIMLGNRPPCRLLRLQGLLPRSLDGGDNCLEAACCGCSLGQIWNPAGEDIAFDTCFELPPSGHPALQVKLSTRTASRIGRIPTMPDTSPYDLIAEFYDEDMGLNNPGQDIGFYVQRAVRAGGNILELGCGTGRITLPLVRAGCRAVGLDLSMPMLRPAISG